METLSEMILSVCTLSIIAGLIAALVPEGKFAAQIKLMTASLLIIGILSPFVGAAKELTLTHSAFEEVETEELQELTDEQVKALAEAELEEVLRQELAQRAVPIGQIAVRMNIDETSSINITSVDIVSTKPAEAKAAIEEILGEDVCVNAGEAENEVS